MVSSVPPQAISNGTNHLRVLSGGSALRVFAVYPREETGRQGEEEAEEEEEGWHAGTSAQEGTDC